MSIRGQSQLDSTDRGVEDLANDSLMAQTYHKTLFDGGINTVEKPSIKVGSS